MFRSLVQSMASVFLAAWLPALPGFATRAQGFRVTEVFLKAEEAQMSGQCPLRVIFSGYVTAQGAGTVRYTFARSDGATGPVHTVEFREAGTQAVTTDWTLGDASTLPSYEGWQTIRILSPNEMESSRETGRFSINCKEGGKTLIFGPPTPVIVLGPDSSDGSARATAETAFGLHTATFDTPQGTITVNLPDDTAPGDTISGTLFTKPHGSTEAEREKNHDQLNGYVAEIDRRQVRAGKQSGKWLVPDAVSTIPLVLKNREGEEVGRVQVPVEPAPEIPAGEKPPSGSDLHADYRIPSVAQAGKTLEIKGAFDGDLETTGITIANQSALMLAESPRKAVAQSPANAVGVADIEVSENGVVVARCAYRSIGVRLSSGKSSLTRGEQTTMDITLSGLDGLDAPATVRLVNRSPGTVRVEGGETQQLAVDPKQVQRGVYTTTKTLTGVAPGGFSINAVVEQTGNLLSRCDPFGKAGRPVTALSRSEVEKEASPQKATAQNPAVDADAQQPRVYTSRDVQPMPTPQPVVPRLPTRGRFRVTLNSFKVNHQTDDNRIEGDGRGDEIFVMADVWEVDTVRGRIPHRRNFRSRVMGDPVNHPERVPAGSAAPGTLDVGGVNGGLITDDVFPSSPWRRAGESQRDRLPLLLWEGELVSRENLAIIAPSVWEWDDPATSPSERRWRDWSEQADGGLDALGHSLYAIMRPDGIGRGRDSVMPSLVEVGNDQGGTRPIGWERTLARSDRTVSERPTETGAVRLGVLWLSYETALAVAEGEHGVRDPRTGRPVRGVIPVFYADRERYGNGSYTLYVQVERIH